MRRLALRLAVAATLAGWAVTLTACLAGDPTLALRGIVAALAATLTAGIAGKE